MTNSEIKELLKEIAKDPCEEKIRMLLREVENKKSTSLKKVGLDKEKVRRFQSMLEIKDKLIRLFEELCSNPTVDGFAEFKKAFEEEKDKGFSDIELGIPDEIIIDFKERLPELTSPKQKFYQIIGGTCASLSKTKDGLKVAEAIAENMFISEDIVNKLYGL